MDEDVRQLERAARECIEARSGRPLSDEEWATTQDNLLELARLARDWSQQATENNKAP